MIMKSNQDDGFGPPKQSIEVECLHCGHKYQSREMKFEVRHGYGPIWYCKMPQCDGAGFGWDIFPSNELIAPQPLVFKRKKSKSSNKCGKR